MTTTKAQPQQIPEGWNRAGDRHYFREVTDETRIDVWVSRGNGRIQIIDGLGTTHGLHIELSKGEVNDLILTLWQALEISQGLPDFAF